MTKQKKVIKKKDIRFTITNIKDFKQEVIVFLCPCCNEYIEILLQSDGKTKIASKILEVNKFIK